MSKVVEITVSENHIGKMKSVNNVEAVAGKGLVKTTEFMLKGAKALPFNQGGNADGIRSMIGGSWR